MIETGARNSTELHIETLEQLNTRYATALLPLTIAIGFFIFLGVIGNVLTLFVFSWSRVYHSNNFTVFVIAFAVIDLTTCITLLPAEMITHRYYFTFQDEGLCKAKCFFTVFGASASCLALLVISADRYRQVVQPMKMQLTAKLAMILLFIVVFVFSIVLAVPGTVMCGIHNTNKTNIYGESTEIHICETSDQYRKSVWRMLYKYVLIILQLGMSLTYIILYAFVMQEACKHIKDIAKLKNNPSFKQRHHSVGNDVNTNIQNAADTRGRSIKAFDELLGSDPLQLEDLKEMGNRPAPTSQQSVMSTTVNDFPTKTIVWFILTLIFIITYMTHMGLILRTSDIVHMSTKEFTWFLCFYRVYFINHIINPIVYVIFVKRFRMSCRKVIAAIKERILDSRVR